MPCSPRRTIRLYATPLILVAALLTSLSACATAPEGGFSPTTRELPAQSPGARGLIVIVHGANHTADEWPRQVESRIRKLDGSQEWDMVRVNWPEMSDRYLTAAGTGYRLGRRFGWQLAGDDYTYEIVHLIGSSLGSHVIHGMAKAYRETLADAAGPAATRARPALIHMTFIEPFFARGLLGLWYGRYEFGRYADFAENYFVRDDPVLFSNAPLVHAANFDLTALVPPRENPYFTYYHDYPLVYYRENVGRLRPGPALSPVGLHALDDGRTYNPAVLRELLPPGEVVEVR